MKKLVCFGLALMLCAPVMAQNAGLLDFSGGSAYSCYYGGTVGDVIGWGFSVNDPIVVTDLGCWIDTDGMQSPHQVGIWDMNQNLLASATVDPNTAIPYNGFNYQSISNLPLSAGESYVIGAMYTCDDNDSYISSASTGNFTPEITWFDSRYPLDGLQGFVFPVSISGSIGRFGPNFLWIPEPSTLLALAGLALLRRR